MEGTESLEDALKREVFEETSWVVIGLGDQVLEAKWTTQGSDGPVEWEEHIFFVDAEGDLSNPALESGKVEACGWFREEDCGALLENREPGDDHVFRIAKKAFARLREAP